MTMHDRVSAVAESATPEPAGGHGKRVLLAEPRGYCAGVDRAVETVEQALERHGPPVYVRHEIVHNRHVVEGLRAHDVPAFTVQYHPEAAAGPHDADYLFDRFRELIAGEKVSA